MSSNSIETVGELISSLKKFDKNKKISFDVMCTEYDVSNIIREYEDKVLMFQK